MAKVIIVDENDNQIDLKEYQDVQPSDIYRVSALLLTDEATGDTLITQRKWDKKNNPGKWMSAVSGTIEENETYDDNIVHETMEEIGVTNLTFVKGPKRYVDDGEHKYFVQWYVATTDKTTTSITIQDEEVEAYRWVSKHELTSELNHEPDKFVPSLRRSLQLIGYLD